MSFARQMMESSPNSTTDPQALEACIQACVDCAQACTSCADACLGEQNPSMLARCIRLDLDCADLCSATGAIVSRQTATEPQLVRAALEACVTACRLCGDECETHAQHGMDHCRVCAEACRRCERACTTLAEQMVA